MDRRSKNINVKNKSRMKNSRNLIAKQETDMTANVMEDAMSLFKTLDPYRKPNGPDINVKHYDRSNVKLKYPDNVIVVPSPIGASPPPEAGEIRRPNISDAIEYAAIQAAIGAAKRWSIIVYGGSFFNDCVISTPKSNIKVSGVLGLKLVFRLVLRLVFRLGLE